jgi:hypothetical protein
MVNEILIRLFGPMTGSEQKYWWQGPNSPFSPGAAQGQGIAAASTNQAAAPSRAVIGCSGDGCGGFDKANTPSTSSNLWWKQPDNPCSTHQGPDCPGGYSCVNYQSCSNGVQVAGSGQSNYRPSAQEVS